MYIFLCIAVFYIVFISLVFCVFFLLFSFDFPPHFRDFLGTPVFHTLEFQYNFSNIVRFGMNELLNWGMQSSVVYQLFFALYYSLASVFVYFAFRNFTQVLHIQKSKMQAVFLMLCTAIIVCSPWAMERMLMGQLGLVLGLGLLFFNSSQIFLLLQNISSKKSVWQNNLLHIAFLICGLAFASLITPHFPLLALGILLCGLIVHTIRNNKKTAVLHSLFLFLCVSVLPALLFLGKYSGENQHNTYLSSDQNTEIIASFSLWEGGDNFFINSLIGKNSWMSGGFIETQKTQELLEVFSNASVYFNVYLGFGLIILVFYLYIFTAQSVWKNKDYSFYTIFPFIALPLSLVLNFGYSSGFHAINQWFYMLPFSYVFREGGKFYAVSLLCISIITLLFYKYSSAFRKKIVIGFASFIALSCILPFLYIGKTLNTPQYPSIFYELEKECTPEKKILYVPMVQYALTDYSPQIFSMTPDKYFFSCERVKHSLTYVGNENIEISGDETYSPLAKSILNLSKSRKQTHYIDLINEISQSSVSFAIVDTTNNGMQTLQFLENFTVFHPVYMQEGNIFIFKFEP